MNLMQSLGLENVEADPNNIPDGKYDGIVSDSTYVVSDKKNTVSHVITYKVTDGSYNGAQRQEWFQIGTNPVKGDGGALVSCNMTMTDQAKQWYKKRLVDLGVAGDQIPTLDIETLKDIPVTFGVKRNGQYVNVNFAERRVVDGATPQATVTSTPSETPQAQATPSGVAGLL